MDTISFYFMSLFTVHKIKKDSNSTVIVRAQLKCGDEVLAVSTLAKEEKMEERIEERKLIIHKIVIDLETAKSIVEKGKTKFLQN
ncbi:hypothetical protein KAU88_08030 [Candidatus Bathyarchaeota archaeon]|nr:hypothetical protein [Candidatus Bathyarchaeota archaeon]